MRHQILSRLSILLAMLAFTLRFVLPSPQVSTTLLVWVLSGLQRAQQYGDAGENQSAHLFAARGEYEAFQVIVQAPQGGLDGIFVTSSNFVNSTGGILGNAIITLYSEHFVSVDRRSPGQGLNSSQSAGYFPDALLPIDGATGRPADPAGGGFNLDAGRNFPIWVDIFVPRDAAPGEYRGQIDISTSMGSRVVPVTLTVWNFELPLQPSLKSSFGFRRSGYQIDEELLRHKIMPQHLDSRGCIAGCNKMERENELIASMGLTTIDTGSWSGADIGNCNMKAAPPPEHFEQLAGSHATGIALYNYTADEVDACPRIVEKLKEWGRNMRPSGIKNLVVMAPRTDLFDDASGSGRSAVDIWVVLPKMYESSNGVIQQALQKGDEVWSYNALSQDGYSPKWLIDYPLLNYRIQPGFINQALGLTGLLYWRVDNWSRTQWDQVNNQGTFSRANFPGEGILVYPGWPVGNAGVVPSMRLKQLREGVEDFEYIEILKGLGRGAWALDVARSVGSDWVNWSHDPEALIAARMRLGEEISRLYTEQENLPVPDARDR